MLYIFWFLHQTTTLTLFYMANNSCISFDSYIKPQRYSFLHVFRQVVYLLIPTSNHNPFFVRFALRLLYIFWFLHQTTTQKVLPQCLQCCISFDSYIKPQRSSILSWMLASCISFDSYIKPQPWVTMTEWKSVVYLLIPTSNHNLAITGKLLKRVVYLLIPTSNHNRLRLGSGFRFVVYLLIPTSNHNADVAVRVIVELYIFWFLHQTTTARFLSIYLRCCISFDSYIKPQPEVTLSRSKSSCISFDSYIKPQLPLQWGIFLIVVYLLIPTSNHNLDSVLKEVFALYIFWFLHQTTTYNF